jgi:hypothetical protein
MVFTTPSSCTHVFVLVHYITESSGEKGKEDEDETEDGKQPSFTVLLHGSLKVEGMVAVTRVA